MRLIDVLGSLKVGRIYSVECRTRDPDTNKILILEYRGYRSKISAKYYIFYDYVNEELVEFRYSQLVNVEFIE